MLEKESLRPVDVPGVERIVLSGMSKLPFAKISTNNLSGVPMASLLLQEWSIAAGKTVTSVSGDDSLVLSTIR